MASVAASGRAAGMADLKATILKDVPVDGQVVYVDFWASWCAPCKKSFPWMQTMQKEYGKQGLVIVAVNLDEDRTKADKFLARTPHDFLVSFDDSQKLAEAFDLQAMPTSLLFGRDGTLQTRHEGFENRGRGELQEQIRKALAEPAPKSAD
jgi:thiol-disulfide isomerase/thioredoxin